MDHKLNRYMPGVTLVMGIALIVFLILMGWR